MVNKVRANAIKRILKDVSDIEKENVPNIGVCIPDSSNVFSIHCNVLISEGPYKDITIHMILQIPEDYPLSAPSGYIAPGLSFDHRYHSHVFGNELCTDTLKNFNHFDTRSNTGWSSGYTLSTLLYVIMMFFSDKDVIEIKVTENMRDEVLIMTKRFKCEKCNHTYENPIPRINLLDDIHKNTNRQLVEKLTCGITKLNVLEDGICLGYPILMVRNRRNLFIPTIILEPICYDAYTSEIQRSGTDKLDSYEYFRFRSITNKEYNHWLPIYINSKHFLDNRQTIQNSLSIIYYSDADGRKEKDFKPTMALKVLVRLINQSIVQLCNGNLFESNSAIEAFCHFLRLIMHFIDIYPCIEEEIDSMIRSFISSLEDRHKKNVPDIGEFLICIALSRTYTLKDIRDYVYEEYFTRQIYWMSLQFNLNCIDESQLESLFKATKVSNHLLMFNIEMTKKFVFEGVKQKLDEMHGLPPERVVESFKDTIKRIKSVNSYCPFISCIGYEHKVKGNLSMVKLIKDSINLSNRQCYTNL